jgi:hypothetical protein
MASLEETAIAGLRKAALESLEKLDLSNPHAIKSWWEDGQYSPFGAYKNWSLVLGVKQDHSINNLFRLEQVNPTTPSQRQTVRNLLSRLPSDLFANFSRAGNPAATYRLFSDFDDTKLNDLLRESTHNLINDSFVGESDIRKTMDAYDSAKEIYRKVNAGLLDSRGGDRSTEEKWNRYYGAVLNDFIDYAKKNPHAKLSVPTTILSSKDYSENDIPVFSHLKKYLKDAVRDLPDNILFRAGSYTHNGNSIPTLASGQGHSIFRAATDLEELFQDEPDVLSKHMSRIKKDLELDHSEAAETITENGVDLSKASPLVADVMAQRGYFSFLRSKNDVSLPVFEKKAKQLAEGVEKGALRPAALTTLLSDPEDTNAEVISPEVAAHLHSVYENYKPPISLLGEDKYFDPRPELTNTVKEHLWVRGNNISVSNAAKFWNDYEQDVGNDHFPIAHAAMTGKHQKHKPYRVDKEGGDEEWVDSHGSESLWPELQTHAKISQHAIASLVSQNSINKRQKNHIFRKDNKGNIYVKVYRGIGGKHAKEVKETHDNGGKIPVAPIQSWSLSPSEANGFAHRNLTVGGVHAGSVISAWLPLKNAVHFGKMAHSGFYPKHHGEEEIVFHHPESSILAEKVFDITHEDERTKLTSHPMYGFSSSPKPHEISIKDAINHSGDASYWEKVKSEIKPEAIRSKNDARYWNQRFDGMKFDSPEHAKSYMSWAMGHKNTDPKMIDEHFNVVPHESEAGKFSAKIKPESETHFAVAEEQRKEKYKQKQKKKTNSHLIKSPNYWLSRLLSKAPDFDFADEKEAHQAIDQEVAHFNEANNQNVKKEDIDKLISVVPSKMQFVGEGGNLNEAQQSILDKFKGRFSFDHSPEVKAKRQAHENKWSKFFPEIPKSFMDNEILKYNAPVVTESGHEIGHEPVMKELAYGAAESYFRNVLKSPEKHEEVKDDLRNRIDKHFHKFYSHQIDKYKNLTLKPVNPTEPKKKAV